ncbi:MAG: phosphatase PAP2 family protein [Nocardioidaceae bacterium]
MTGQHSGGSAQPGAYLDTVTSDAATARDEPTASRHGPVAQLLIALAPLSLILLAYGLATWISAPLEQRLGAGVNRLGFGVHVTGPARVDAWLFGAVPSVWLQERLVDGSGHWYDAAAALVYSTHFVAIPVVTALAWFRRRDRFTAWIAAVLAFTTVGVGGYVGYPAAPPWLASDLGEIGPVVRISALGWDYLHLDLPGRLTALGQDSSNPVAAMPSLHAGSAMLVALFLWPLASRAWRAVLIAYVVAMAVTLVYTGEHYVADVVAGWLTAAVAVAVGAGLHHLRSQRRAKVEAGSA